MRLVIAAGTVATAILLAVANNAIEALTREGEQLQRQVEDIAPEVAAGAQERIDQLGEDLADQVESIPVPAIIVRTTPAPGPEGPQGRPGEPGRVVVTRTVTSTPAPTHRPRKPAQARPSPSPSPSPTRAPCAVDGALADVFCPPTAP